MLYLCLLLSAPDYPQTSKRMASHYSLGVSHIVESGNIDRSTTLRGEGMTREHRLGPQPTVFVIWTLQPQNRAENLCVSIIKSSTGRLKTSVNTTLMSTTSALKCEVFFVTLALLWKYCTAERDSRGQISYQAQSHWHESAAASTRSAFGTSFHVGYRPVWVGNN